MSDVETLRLAASALITAVEEHPAAVTEGTDPSAEHETLLRAGPAAPSLPRRQADHRAELVPEHARGDAHRPA
ncbi:hypothetical protein [Nonomuraea rubra]|uniref:hypothetical protein n=1 Tax=Nonomuraea rubra TaxID=46180 RepID=UPI0033C450F4